ncbi:hypothetical protein STEG23_032468, partial [Scotinomys teguina]
MVGGLSGFGTLTDEVLRALKTHHSITGFPLLLDCSRKANQKAKAEDEHDEPQEG